MRLNSNVRSVLLAGSAIALVSACSDADIVSPGTTGPVTVNINQGGGGANFAARTTRPLQDTDCTVNGLQFTDSFTLPSGATTEICQFDTSAPITTPVNIPFTGDPIYLNGVLTVAAGGSLTLAPGQVVIGTEIDAANADAIFVQQGAQIFAEGTANNPIVFTSVEDLDDDGAPNGSTQAAEWGGFVINGFAKINACENPTTATPGTAACTKNGEGSSGLFGGDDDDDNSGVLRFVRVQNAGKLVNALNELNGIAFQGVGRGTTVEFVQVHKNADDGIEWFGGTVNGRYIVVTGAEDDSFDWTDGWRGNVQYAVARQLGDNGNRGVEADSREGAAGQGVPEGVFSSPNFANFTFVGRNGGGENDGVKLRRGTTGEYVNGIVTNFALDGFDYDADAASAGDPSLNAVHFFGNGEDIENNASTQAVFDAGALNSEGSTSTIVSVFPGPNEAGLAAVDPSVAISNDTINNDGDFEFDDATFAGAFDPVNETAQSNWSTGWTIALSSCPEGTTQSTEPVPAGRDEALVCIVNNPVVGDVTLTRGNLYQVSGSVFVGRDAGKDPANPLSTAVESTLTIDPGVTVFGSSGPDVLIVARGSQLIADGTAAEPIVFTSRAAVSGAATAPGQWGGLVINGRAPINDCASGSVTPPSIDCEKNGEGSSGLFGGATPDDNSGVLRYVRVEYAGRLINALNELNGIAFQGVGSGTEVDFVQVHANQDDGVEFFGGTVEANHLVITNANDDSVDWTDGWAGSAQFVIVVQGGTVTNRAIEADSREGAADLNPRSAPTIANMTIISDATGESDTIRLRRGTDGKFYNFLVSNGADGVIDFDDDSAVADADVPAFNTFPQFFGSVVVASQVGADTVEGDPTGGLIFSAANGNVDNSALASTLSLGGAGVATPLIPGANEAGTPTTGLATEDARLVDADYVGAVENASDTWFAGWTTPGSF